MERASGGVGYDGTVVHLVWKSKKKKSRVSAEEKKPSACQGLLSARKKATLSSARKKAKLWSARKKTRLWSARKKAKLLSATYPFVVQLEPDFIFAVHVVQAASVVLEKGGKGRGHNAHV